MEASICAFRITSLILASICSQCALQLSAPMFVYNANILIYLPVELVSQRLGDEEAGLANEYWNV